MSEDTILHREMGCTRAEFLAWLPGAVNGAQFDVDGDSIRVRYQAGEVLIRIAQTADRKLGLMLLPVLRVSIEFSDLDGAARKSFLGRFDLFTRRGGG
ncbi:MAG TPA: hypothetical protein VH278_17850 [Burkholderiaceae bacterium]|jgi:hypothetical protein|nr:hypothetical protein [Burkholderiaceae bacterium]